MSAPAMKTIQGYITIVQELRFRLETDGGQNVLLTLADNANVGYDELRRLHEQRAHVTVRYSGEPNLASGIAHRISDAG